MGWKQGWRIMAVLSAAALVLTSCSDTAVVRSGDDLPSITARGVGEATGVPDTVVIVLGVETEAAQAADALARNNESSEAVMQVLRDAGVEEEDIKTSQFSISPRFGEGSGLPPGLIVPPGAGQGDIVGYRVTNLVTARMSADAGAGELIDAAAEAAGDQIRVQSVQFEIDDTDSLYAEARADAVERATQQAEQLAEAAGVELGAVRSVTESGVRGDPSPLLARTGPEAGDGGGGFGSVGLSPGSQELMLGVEMVFEISG
ncbi:MAG: SIMPL domain-containing protein [Actinomycetota bacterium]